MVAKGLVEDQKMKIKFKNALIVWFVLAVSIVGKDMVVEHAGYFDGDSTKEPDKGEYPFIIDVRPRDAKVMVMNIGPKYIKGMILPKGEYDIKVSRHGYETERMWVKHADDSPHVIRLKESG